MWNEKTVSDKSIIYINTNTGEEASASLVYNHPELGRFFMFDSIMTMPFQRKYVFDLIQQNERIGIEKKELLTHLESVKEFINAGKPNEAFGTVMYIESKLKDGWDYQKSSLLICALLVVQEDENINGFNQSDAEEKINKWAVDLTMLSFFLNFAQLRINSLMNFVNRSSSTFSAVVSQSTESQPQPSSES